MRKEQEEEEEEDEGGGIRRRKRKKQGRSRAFPQLGDLLPYTSHSAMGLLPSTHSIPNVPSMA